MVEIRRILCPIDFSETSRHAIQHAVAIATSYGSQITALHVIHVPLLPPPPIFFVDPSTLLPSVSDRQLREEELRAWLEPARRAGVKTDVVVNEGNAATAIVEYGKSYRADLVVMGTHGLSGFERFMLGSVAEKVLRKADGPVMTVPPASQTAATVPYTRLLCPVDFSDSSIAALRFAVSMAEQAHANLTILHVFDWPPPDELLVQPVDVPEFHRLVEGDARRRLETVLTDEVQARCTASTRIAYGKPYREILQAAEKEGADLIVIGVRGRNPLDLAMFGSTTNQVVRRASCPVLTLRQ